MKTVDISSARRVKFSFRPPRSAKAVKNRKNTVAQFCRQVRKRLRMEKRLQGPGFPEFSAHLDPWPADVIWSRSVEPEEGS